MRGRIPLATASMGLASFLFLIMPLSAPAAEEVIYKKLSASKALGTAAKNLAKSKSYKAKMVLEGGVTERDDHELTDKAVKESFQGDVFGTLMHVPQDAGTEAYRYPKKGVAFVDGMWRPSMSNPKTQKMERLFTFPQVVLSRALASGNAKWMKPPEKKDLTDAKDKEKEKEAKKPEEDDSKGKGVDTSNFRSAAAEDDEEKPPEKAAAKKAEKKATDKAVAKKADPKKSAATKTTPKKSEPAKKVEEDQQPRFVRVEASPQEALEHFTDIQNSGCLGAG